MVRITQVTALILQAIGLGHRYGFDIMDATGLASGTVYPALRRLEEGQLIRGTWEAGTEAQRDGRPQRRLYELTATGEIARLEALQRLRSARALMMDPSLTSEA